MPYTLGGRTPYTDGEFSTAGIPLFDINTSGSGVVSYDATTDQFITRLDTHTFYDSSGTALAFVDANGFNGEGSQLTGFTASQIPNLDASKITTGTLVNDRLPATISQTDIYGNTGVFNSVGTSVIYSAGIFGGSPVVPIPSTLGYASDTHTFTNFAGSSTYLTIDTNGLTLDQINFNTLGSTDYVKIFTRGTEDDDNNNLDHNLVIELGDDSDPADFVIERNATGGGGSITELLRLDGQSGDLTLTSVIGCAVVSTSVSVITPTITATTKVETDLIEARLGPTITMGDTTIFNDGFRPNGSNYNITWDGGLNRIVSYDPWAIGGVSSLPPVGSSVVPLVGKPANSTDVMRLFESGGTDVFQVAETFTRCYEAFIARKDTYAGLSIVPSAASYVDLEFVNSSGVGEGATANPVMRWYNGLVQLFGGLGGTCDFQITSGSLLAESMKGTTPFIEATTYGNYLRAFSDANNYSDSDNLIIRARGGAEKARFDNINGNLGIGTTNPIYKLDVNGDQRLLGYLLASSFTNQTEAVFSCNNGAFLTIECFNYGNTIKRPVCLNPYGGNVGIGTTSPSTKLEIETTANNHLRLRYNTAGNFYWDIYRWSNAGEFVVVDGVNGRRFTIHPTGGRIQLDGDGANRFLATGGHYFLNQSYGYQGAYAGNWGTNPVPAIYDPMFINQSDNSVSSYFYRGLRLSSTVGGYQQDWRYAVDNITTTSYANWNYNGVIKMYLSSAGNLVITGTYTPFTGTHEPVKEQEDDQYENGSVLISLGTEKNALNISDTKFKVANSDRIKDKRVIGVALYITDECDYQPLPEKKQREVVDEEGNTTYEYYEEEQPKVQYTNVGKLQIMSVGEGQMLVCNENGNIENGDYICSASQPYGMKQDSEFVANYTIAKATEDCIFEEGETKKLISVVFCCG